MGALDSLNFMAMNLLTGDGTEAGGGGGGGMSGGAGAGPAHGESRFEFSDGRWVNETYNANTGQWQAEDTSAADQREQALTKGYADKAPVAAAPPPPMAGMGAPPMGGMGAPPQGMAYGGAPSTASLTSQRYFNSGGAPQGQYVDVMQQQGQLAGGYH